MDNKFKYIEIYNHYRELIISGSIGANTRLPSIREYAKNQGVSRTTVVTAYECLAADGYIYSKPQSGYYASKNAVHSKFEQNDSIIKESEPNFDLTSENADINSFDFKLWQRYIKSALRNSDRLLTYGNAQGEYELRKAISDYLIKTRSAVCSHDNIIIGAGFQSLLSLILPLIKDKKGVYFTNAGFHQGKASFSDNGFESADEQDAQIYYITPSRLTEKGDVMSPEQRYSFASKIKQQNLLVIEDDYGSEFSMSGRKVPCLQGICGGQNVIYISTFSKLLIPSIRISYAVLPNDLLKNYLPRKHLYNQTASKIEQLALCKFIEDGHIKSQMRKIRRIYNEKSAKVKKYAFELFGESATVVEIDSGRYLKLVFKKDINTKEICKNAKKKSLIIAPSIHDKNAFIISYYGLEDEKIKSAFKILRDVIKI